MNTWHEDPPIYAAVNNHDLKDKAAVVEELLSQQEDPNASDYNGNLPLACTDVLQDNDLLKILLRGGANPNGISNGEEILSRLIRHCSVERKHDRRHSFLQSIVILLEAGANPNGVQSVRERSPLWVAIQWKCLEAIAMLVEAGADIRLTDEQGRDAIEWCIQWEDMETITMLAGKAVADGARDRIPDPKCDAICQEIVDLIGNKNHKLRLLSPGYKYEWEEVREVYFYDHSWVCVGGRASGKRVFKVDERVSELCTDSDGFVAWLKQRRILGDQWLGPRRDRWQSLLRRCIPRSDDDLILRIQ